MSSDKDKKVIHLNPIWFNGGSMKTRKRRTTPLSSTTDDDTPAPVSPMLKQKILMRRIKENKLQQLNSFTSSSNVASNPAAAAIKSSPATPQPHKDDDFIDSMDFLQNLSSIKMLDREKELYEKNKLKRREDLYNRTIHNPYRLKNHNIITPNNDFLVDVNIPDELTTTKHFESLDTVIPTYNVDKVVPYGVLRNGIKPTYRDWKRTTPSATSITTSTPNTTAHGNILTPRLLAQRKIQMLREKIRASQRAPDNPLEHMGMDGGRSSNGSNIENINSSGISFDSNPPSTFETIYQGDATTATTEEAAAANIPKGVPFKKLIKKTFKQKYTLGRSKVKKSIAVLIKNSTIRHHVIDAHKKLKSQPLADIKRYLREHNLIKVGTDAPNDVLRQLYENSVLSGDVVNINGGTLLHNFTNSKAGEHVIDGLEPFEIEDIFKDDA